MHARPGVRTAHEGRLPCALVSVYIVTEASGGVSVEAHEMAIQRMVQAGAVPITWMILGAELQRDWARTATVDAVARMLVEHAGVVGTSFTWEQQLLATPPAR